MSERIRALTLWQPWASLIMVGVKRHETRQWGAPTALIGQRLAIHAALRPVSAISGELADLCATALGSGLGLPFGAVMGTVRVTGCRPTYETTPATHGDRIAGNWAIGRWAWELDDIERFARPVAARGRQGLWWWTP